MITLPEDGIDISPIFSAEMHRSCKSKLHQQCQTLNVSINDREKVHTEMKRVEQKMLFGEVVK